MFYFNEESVVTSTSVGKSECNFKQAISHYSARTSKRASKSHPVFCPATECSKDIHEALSNLYYIRPFARNLVENKLLA